MRQRTYEDGKGNFVTRTRVGTKIRAVRSGHEKPRPEPIDSPGLFPMGAAAAPGFGSRTAKIVEIAKNQQRGKRRTDK